VTNLSPAPSPTRRGVRQQFFGRQVMPRPLSDAERGVPARGLGPTALLAPPSREIPESLFFHEWLHSTKREGESYGLSLTFFASLSGCLFVWHTDFPQPLGIGKCPVIARSEATKQSPTGRMRLLCFARNDGARYLPVLKPKNTLGKSVWQDNFARAALRIVGTCGYGPSVVSLTVRS